MHDRYPAKGYFIGRYFLRTYPGSPNWYVAWFNRTTRETDRTSLETADLEEAKIRGAEIISVYGDLRNERPEAVTLSQVFDRYHAHYGKELTSGREQRRHLDYWVDFFGKTATVADAQPARQHQFVSWLRAKPYENGTIKRILASGCAALRWCYQQGELQAVPHVIAVKESEPRERVLEAAEIKALWEAAAGLDELRRYLMVLLNTACRPKAARDLTVFQVDLARNRLDLNPAGGRRRPSVGRPYPSRTPYVPG